MTKKIILLISIAGPFVAYYFYVYLVQLKKRKYPIKTLSLISIALVFASLGYLRFDENYSPNLTKPNINLKPFDVVVQRGTNHAWVNNGKEPALLVAVLIDSKIN